LDRIGAWRSYPEKMRADNHPEPTSIILVEWTEKHGVKLEFIQPGKPAQNAVIERFNRTFRQKVLNMNAFRFLSEVREITNI